MATTKEFFIRVGLLIQLDEQVIKDGKLTVEMLKEAILKGSFSGETYMPEGFDDENEPFLDAEPSWLLSGKLIP